MDKLKDIMLVEDEPDIREIATIALSEVGGFNLCVCESGQEALKKIKDFRAQLILLDVMMPGMDGLSAMAKIKALPQYKDIPIIFMTARVQSHEIDEYMTMGAIGVIPKPFNPGTLSNEISQIWNEYRSF